MTDQNKFYLTKEGFKKIQKEYQVLKDLRIAKVKGEAPKIWQSEDLNPEYLSFQEDLDLFDYRITELENVLKNTEIIKAPSKNNKNIIGLGATITLEESDGQINEFMLVGTLEANPSEGKISSDSLVGKILLGKKEGEEVLITSPIKVSYRVKKINYYLS